MNKNQGLVHSLLLGAFLSLGSTSVHAQLTPDNTLATEASKLTPNVLINGASADLINGGALRGSNLFHSFSEFNIKDGQGVYFANPSGVVNILTRVTGSNASNILGTLGVDGAANLFLINPNGILFGQNARLDIGGSFVGTTANGVQFGNQGNFSATNPEAPGLLTVNPSALFFNQINPNATIQSNSIAPSGINPLGNARANGLRVPDGKSLLLVGGDVNIDGDNLPNLSGLLAFGGRVELGGLSAPGTVGLETNDNIWSLVFPETVERGSVSLSNKAIINVFSQAGGDIVINARNIDISSASTLSTGILSGRETINSQAGGITINATEQIRLDGYETYIFNLVAPNATGNSGDIRITTGSLSVTNGSTISTSVLGQGSAGNIIIDARENVLFDGIAISEDGASISGVVSSVLPGGVGKGGDIHIKTGSLSVKEGALLLASTYGQGRAGDITISARDRVIFKGASQIDRSLAGSAVQAGATGEGGNIRIDTGYAEVIDGAVLYANTFGSGSAGNIQIAASNSVDITGTSPQFGNSSGLFTNTAANAKGGDITINTNALRLSNGGVIDARTSADGNSGNITVNSNTVDINRGGQFLAITQGKGQAGNITVNAATRVKIDGTDPTYSERLSSFGDQVSPISANSGIFVLSQNSGGAGDITVNTQQLILANQGILSAESNTVDGGNINLNLNNFLLLRRNSKISATAGIAQQNGDGGNITINTPFIVAVPSENSDITANAFTGRGGNVNIRAQGIFGIEPRAIESSLFSDITASSERGVQGEVSITEPDVKPAQGLIELPEEVVDATRRVAQICPREPGAKQERRIYHHRTGFFTTQPPRSFTWYN
ncbi:hypothetical protein CAL7716_059720 [Calothrix sp. PCC 7716]|nr:hypothetical protein CAL7716_059720 [Calothrix sp. PCC 7716]